MMFLMLLLSFGPILNNFFPESLLVSIYGHILLVIITIILMVKEKFSHTLMPFIVIAIPYFLSVSAAILRGHEPFWLIIGAVDNLKTLAPMLLIMALPWQYFILKDIDYKIAKTYGLVLFVSILGGVLSQFFVYVRQLLDVLTVREMIRYGVERSSSIYIGVNMFVKMNLVSFLGMSIRGFNIWLALILWLTVAVLTYSRQFVLGVFVSLFAGYILSKVKVRLKKKYLFIIFSTIVMLIIFSTYSSLNSDYSSFSESDGRLTNLSESILRIGVAYASLNCATSYPFGVGPGNFGGNIGKKIENNDYLYECGVNKIFPLFDLALHYTDSQAAEMLGSLGFGTIIIFIILFHFIKKIASTLNAKGKFLLYSASVFIGIQFIVSPILNYFEFILPFTFLLRALLVNFISDKSRI